MHTRPAIGARVPRTTIQPRFETSRWRPSAYPTGSVAMTLIGILIGAPVGMLAGTYLAEYGRFMVFMGHADKGIAAAG